MIRRTKLIVGDRVIGNDKRASFRERKGTVLQHGPQSQYLVEFDDGRKEWVNSEWLDKVTD